MASLSCGVVERRGRDSRSIPYLVIFRDKRNSCGWKKKRIKSIYDGSKDNLMQEDETYKLKWGFGWRRKTNLRIGPKPRSILYSASKQF